MLLYHELKRRNVFRVGAAYIVAAWLIIQVVETIFPAFGFGDAAIRLVVIAFAIGLVPALVISWVFEITSEGLKKEKDVDRSVSVTYKTGKQLDRIIMVVLALALGFFAFDKFVLSESREATIAEEARQQGRSDALVKSYGDNSIAVLPFVNMSSDPEQEFFTDGITEELLNLLAKIPDLRVTARTSSFFFKGKEMPVSEIAEALNVTHILEGSVRRDGNQVRITAQLIEARSDTHLWSDTYDRRLESIFVIQDEVASAIASALVDSFTGLKIKPADRADNVAAFEAYRTGRLRWWRRSPEELHKAIKLFVQATEYDPGFAPAYAAIADSYLLLSSYGNISQMEAIERAQPMIEKALAIDPESAEAFAGQGLAHWQVGKLEAAESSLRHAVSFNGDYVPARLWLGGLLGELGRIPEQGLVLQDAMAIDPLNELLAVNYAANLFSQGDYESTRELMGSFIQVKPDSTMLLRTMAEFASLNGDLVESWEYAKRSYDLNPDSPLVINAMAQAWLNLKEYGRAEEVLRTGLELAQDNRELKIQYFLLMLMSSRMEEAEQMVKEQFDQDINTLPEKFQRFYHYQMGLISLLNGDFRSARDSLVQSINPDETHQFDGNQILSILTVSYLNEKLGDSDAAIEGLATAERVVRRARINGIDHAYIYYTESSIHALRGESQQAIASLREAYNRGWRDNWLLEVDYRLDILRNEPQFLAIKRQIEENISQARAEVRSRLATAD